MLQALQYCKNVWQEIVFLQPEGFFQKYRNRKALNRENVFEKMACFGLYHTQNPESWWAGVEKTFSPV